jgi:hypothetical protein
MTTYPRCPLCGRTVKITPRPEWLQNPTAWSYTHAECRLAVREQKAEG